MVFVHNPSILETEAGGMSVQGQPGGWRDGSAIEYLLLFQKTLPIYTSLGLEMSEGYVSLNKIVLLLHTEN